jgi:hypothetical protein
MEASVRMPAASSLRGFDDLNLTGLGQCPRRRGWCGLPVGDTSSGTTRAYRSRTQEFKQSSVGVDANNIVDLHAYAP